MVDKNYTEENNDNTGALLTDSNHCIEVSDDSKLDLKENEQNVEVRQTQVRPDIVHIYCTAAIENSPFERVAQEILDSMMTTF